MSFPLSSRFPGRLSRQTRSYLPVYLALAVLALLEFAPLAILVSLSLKSQGQIMQNPIAPAAPLHFENYAVAWASIQRYLFNSVLVTVAILVGNLSLSAVAAYVFGRYRFPGRDLLFLLVLGLMMIPGIAILIPRFILVRDLHLLNTLWGVILPGVFGASAFNIFVLRTFFASLPEEMFEAARLDGAGHVHLFLRMVIPLSWPILSSLAILQILWAWNDYIWPLMVLQSDSLRTIAIGLIYFADTRNPQLGIQMAGSVIASLPLLILFLLAMRTFIQGLTSGSLKL